MIDRQYARQMGAGSTIFIIIGSMNVVHIISYQTGVDRCNFVNTICTEHKLVYVQILWYHISP